MSAASISHDTASTATSKAIERIVQNLNEIAGKSPNLKALIAPSEKVITELHHFATTDNPSEDSKSLIANGFKEFGTQVAESLRSLYQKSKTGFKGIVQRAERFTDRLRTFLAPKEVANVDRASSESIEKLVNYATRHEDAINSMTKTDTPIISFRSKAQNGKPFNIIDVKEPLKLFEFIDLAWKRNKLIGRDPDYRIKNLIILAHCIQRHCETRGKFTATKKEVIEKLNLKPRSLISESTIWNQAMTRAKPVSIIHDYDSSLNDQDIKNRDSVLTQYNQSRKKQDIDTLKDPNKLMEYLRLTKQMQAIKVLFDNQPDAEQDPNFRSLDIVMQWYLQLGSDNPIMSLKSYAEQKYGIEDENNLANIKRMKYLWNTGKLTG